MKPKTFLAVCGCIVLTLVQGSWAISRFPKTDIGGGIYAYGSAGVSSVVTYSVWVTVANSSGSIQLNGKWASPFITELEFKVPPGFTLNPSKCFACRYNGGWFAQGWGNPIEYRNTPGLVYLAYNLVPADSSGMDWRFVTAEANDIRNRNAIGGLVAISGGIPMEDYHLGFLDPSPTQWSGAVYFGAIFEIAFNESAEVDRSFYDSPGTLVVRYVGGNGYSMHVANTNISNMADFNGDYSVDFRDFAVLANAWNYCYYHEISSCSDCAEFTYLDLNGDMWLEEEDLRIFCDNWLAP